MSSQSTDRIQIGQDEGFFDNRDTIIDKLERKAEDGPGLRPARNVAEKAMDEIPDGPLGKVGGGNVVGGIGYYLVDVAKVAAIPIPGARSPGWHTISHGVEGFDTFERHTVEMNAATKFIAEFAAEYLVAAPSNIDFLTGEIENHETEVVKERATYNTYRMQIDVADRAQAES